MAKNKLKKKKDKKPKKIVYPSHRCEFIKKNGKRCKKFATGSGVLCEMHGGDPLIPENLLPSHKIPKSILKLTKFDPAIHPIEYIEYSRQGFSKVEIAAKFNVSVGTMENWVLQYQEMNVAFEVGKDQYEAYWLRIGHDNLTNTRFNTSLYKFITGNKLGYSEKVENKNFNTNVHGVLVVPGQCSMKDWKKEAEKAQLEDEIMDAEYEDAD